MKKEQNEIFMIEFLLLMLAVFFVWKILIRTQQRPRICIFLESGDKRWMP